jgi:hypothetical protein
MLLARWRNKKRKKKKGTILLLLLLLLLLYVGGRRIRGIGMVGMTAKINPS